MTDKQNEPSELAAIVALHQILIQDLYLNFLVDQRNTLVSLDSTKKRALDAMREIGQPEATKIAEAFFSLLNEMSEKIEAE